MKTETITLTNDFHGTSVTLRVNGDRLSAGQMRRMRRELCGMSDCCCGTIRGKQTHGLHINQDGTATVYAND
jgi:hypothetical protein